ncbi:MAG: hypothetical protein H0T46_09525 [Deltaproteobacteria bacterium]|nr:hypothetical protein [Deltaproteobacteria bacterium]
MSRALLVVAALSACSDDPIDLTGAYEVQSHVGSSPCGNDTPVMNGGKFLVFHKETFIAEYFVYDECMDAEGTMCSSTGGLLSGLFEPIDNGWKGVASTSSGSGGRCILGYLETTAKLNGSRLVVESNRYSDDTDRPDAECTTEKAEELGDDMPCEEHEHIEAEKR